MKNKMMILVVSGLLFGSLTAMADAPREYVGNWKRPEPQPPFDKLGINAPSGDVEIPVGDTVPYICLLAGAYLTFSLVRKQSKLI
jgi:hypothetical protein